MALVDIRTLGTRKVLRRKLVTVKDPDSEMRSAPVETMVEVEEVQPILTAEEAALLTKDFKPEWVPSSKPFVTYGKYMTRMQGRRFFTDVLPEVETTTDEPDTETVEKKPFKLKGGRGKNN